MLARFDQRQLPGISRLYADFLYAPERLAGLFPAIPAFSPAALRQYAAEGDLERRFPPRRRRQIVDLLAASTPGSHAGAAAKNLESLSRPGAVAVVTGQQVGLFGGPLLTLYKALTAIRLAADLRDAGCPAAPVFWLASQDHDLEEVNQAWLTDGEGEARRIQAALPASANGQPVGEIAFGEELEAALSEWEALAAPATSPAADAATAARPPLARLREAYHPGATFASAFAAALAEWFRPWGLLVLDPLAPGWAALAQPLYLAAFDAAAGLRAALAERDREIETRGYHVQVTQGDTASLLFLQDETHARRLLRRPAPGHGDRWLWGDEPIAATELRRRLEACPQRVSPAALLRPLLQDALLPVLAQVSGPAETAYLAQTAALSPLLGIPAPIPWPRASLTFTDARARRLLERYQLCLEDLFHQPAAELLARASLNPELETSLERLQTGLQAGLEDLLLQLERHDPTLLDAARTAAAKIRHQSDQLAGRVARSIARRNEELRRHAAHLAGWLTPRGQPQERVLNSAAVLARFPHFLERAYEAITPLAADHLVLPL